MNDVAKPRAEIATYFELCERCSKPFFSASYDGNMATRFGELLRQTKPKSGAPASNVAMLVMVRVICRIRLQ